MNLDLIMHVMLNSFNFSSTIYLLVIWNSYINDSFWRNCFRRISENVVEQWGRGACYSSRLFNYLSQWKLLAKVFVIVNYDRNGAFKFIRLNLFENEFYTLKLVDIKVSEKINFISFVVSLLEVVRKCI